MKHKQARKKKRIFLSWCGQKLTSFVRFGKVLFIFIFLLWLCISRSLCESEMIGVDPFLSSTQKNSNLANAASLLWYAYQSLPYPSNQVNWAGTYLIGSLSPAYLPFHRSQILSFLIGPQISYPAWFFPCLLVWKCHIDVRGLSAQARPHLYFCSSAFSVLVWICYDKILSEIYSFLFRLFFFDLAAPLCFSISMGSPRVSIWHENLIKFILYLKNLTFLIQPPCWHIPYLSLFIYLFRILYPLTHTPSRPHSRPLSRKTSLPINPPRPGRLWHRILIQTPSPGPRHARLSGTYCLRRRKSKRDCYPDLPDRSRRAGWTSEAGCGRHRRGL